MIMPSDIEYKETKQIMLGKSFMNPEFDELAKFIDVTFGVKTINIIYDTIGKEKRPRLNICFETTKEAQSFNINSGHINYDKIKQNLISKKFREILLSENAIKKKESFNFFRNSKKEKYNTENVWVCYSAFEPVARIECNEKITQENITKLKNEINNKDIWEISRAFASITFFMYREEQVKYYENSDQRKIWTDKYFELLKQHDEFDYFKRDKLNIFLDSKENFDKNYQSNWFYYYK